MEETVLKEWREGGYKNSTGIIGRFVSGWIPFLVVFGG